MGGNARCLAWGYESFLLAVKLQAADTFTDLALNNSSTGLEAERGSDFPFQGRARESARSGQGTMMWGGRGEAQREEVVCNLVSLEHPKVVFSLRYRNRVWGLSCK